MVYLILCVSVFLGSGPPAFLGFVKESDHGKVETSEVWVAPGLAQCPVAGKGQHGPATWPLLLTGSGEEARTLMYFTGLGVPG